METGTFHQSRSVATCTSGLAGAAARVTSPVFVGEPSLLLQYPTGSVTASAVDCARLTSDTFHIHPTSGITGCAFTFIAGQRSLPLAGGTGFVQAHAVSLRAGNRFRHFTEYQDQERTGASVPVALLDSGAGRAVESGRCWISPGAGSCSAVLWPA